MKADNFDLQRYFDRIGYAGPAAADLATVAAIMRHQLRAVPFENLDVRAGRPISLVPEDIVDKIVQGKINKWYTEVCLTQQPWIRDDKTSLAKIAPQVTVKRFVRWQVGEAL